MSLRRLVPALSVCVLASASVVVAAPKKKAPVAPAKDAGAGSGSGSAAAAGSGSATAPAPVTPNAPVGPEAGGSAAGGADVQMTEDPAPKDMNGTDENPDAPRAVGDPDTGAAPIPATKMATAGYPTEEALRPLTLPENMSELSIGPHFEFSGPLGDTTTNEFISSDALRARYGITRQIQLGLTYEFGGIYKNLSGNTSFNTGKAVGLDVTVLLQNWLAVKLGVPIYLDPVAVGLTLAAPIKFTFGDKFALGGLDDLLLIKLDKFAPSFMYQSDNEVLAHEVSVNTATSAGDLRFSAYGVYQYERNIAIIARIGLRLEDLGSGTTTTNLRGAIQWSPRNYIDLGVGLGFDDLAHGGTFGPNFILAVRI